MKTCGSCKGNFLLTDFHKDRKTKDGHCSACKTCAKAKTLAWNKANRERKRTRAKIWRDTSGYNENYRKENVEYFEQYRKTNAEKIKQWHKDNSQKAYQRRKERYHSDMHFRLSNLLRSRLSTVIRRSQTTKCARTFVLLGCSIEFFKTYLESKFQSDMSWDNYGKWHIDHIKPCAAFDLTQDEQQKQCFHYTNLQPLWAKDNLSKNCRFIT